MIHVCEPSVSELEKKYVMEALENNWLSSTAPPVGLFDRAFAERFDVAHAVAVNSGGSALFLALWTLGIRPGAEVIGPAFTRVSPAGLVTPVRRTRWFVD